MADILRRAQAKVNLQQPSSMIPGVGGSSRLGIAIQSFFRRVPNTMSNPYGIVKYLVYALIFVGLVLLAIYIYNKYKNNKDSLIISGFADINDEIAKRNNDVSKILDNIRYDIKKTPTNEDKLINIQPLTFKQAAFLGPSEENGIFDADGGILKQLTFGSRVFFLQIDYYEDDSNMTPRLRYTKSNGVLTSKNYANLSDVFTSIKDHAFDVNIPDNTNPIILLLHFIKIPSMLDEEKYKNFFGKVSTDLEILNTKSLLLGNGYFNAQKEEDLFKSPSFNEKFKNTVIVGTNVDMSLFADNRIGVTDSINNISTKIHFRYFKENDNIKDATESIPNLSLHPDKKPFALIIDPYTIFDKSDDSGEKIFITPENWSKDHKHFFTIIKTPNDKKLLPHQIKSLLNDYGANVILNDYFINDYEQSKIIRNFYGPTYTIRGKLLQV